MLVSKLLFYPILAAAVAATLTLGFEKYAHSNTREAFATHREAVAVEAARLAEQHEDRMAAVLQKEREAVIAAHALSIQLEREKEDAEKDLGRLDADLRSERVKLRNTLTRCAASTTVLPGATASASGSDATTDGLRGLVVAVAGVGRRYDGRIRVLQSDALAARELCNGR